MEKAIGIFGSSSGKSEPHLNFCYTLGDHLQELGYNLITGTCPGYPFEVARIAFNNRKSKTKIIGISPFGNRTLHLEKGMIEEYHDVIIYTGLGDHIEGKQAYNSRANIITNSVDSAIVFPGSEGTLSELELLIIKEKRIIIISDEVSEFVDKARELFGNKNPNESNKLHIYNFEWLKYKPNYYSKELMKWIEGRI